jgi:nitroimidazol reductase NimA-like FMN-containing flavoprotein (pyridoxamine 5'-phosphate oxidase superfamily)
VDGTPHLIPVSFVWDGERITIGTAENSTTVRNLRRTPVARTAIGHHFDVVLIDGSVDFTSPEEIDTPTAEAFALVAHDPRHMPGPVSPGGRSLAHPVRVLPALYRDRRVPP